MGLDMYLNVKTSRKSYDNKVCSYYENIKEIDITDDKIMFEFGYWRKAYDQRDLICKSIASYTCNDDDCVDFRIMPNEVDTILTEAKKILDTHTFNEYGEDEESEYATWQSERKWKEAIKFFTMARQMLEEDPDAEIYYYQWY